MSEFPACFRVNETLKCRNFRVFTKADTQRVAQYTEPSPVNQYTAKETFLCRSNSKQLLQRQMIGTK